MNPKLVSIFEKKCTQIMFNVCKDVLLIFTLTQNWFKWFESVSIYVFTLYKSHLSGDLRKPDFWVSDLVQHKPGYTAIDRSRLEV